MRRDRVVLLLTAAAALFIGVGLSGDSQAFYGDPRVLTISLHQHPLSLWPGTGWPDEYGEGAATGLHVHDPATGAGFQVFKVFAGPTRRVGADHLNPQTQEFVFPE